MTAVNALSSRYITPDFRTSPLLALTDLLGLKQYSHRITESPEFYGSILTGATLYRHLSAADKMQVNHAIVREMPPCDLQTKLMGLVSDLSVQKLWYMWALSDDEVLEFFNYSSNVAGVTKQFNPVETPSATIASIAGGAYLLSKKGSRAVLSKAASSVTTSPLVLAMGKKIRTRPGWTEGAGRVWRCCDHCHFRYQHYGKKEL